MASWAPGWVTYVAVTAAVVAAAVATALGLEMWIVHDISIPRIYNLLPKYFDGNVQMQTPDVLATFDPYGRLRSVPVEFTPPAMRWDGASNAGPRTYQPSAADFAATTTATTYDLSLVPGPLAGQTCPYVANVTFDARGFVDMCTSFAAPGTPLGSATLDFTGVLPYSQLPPILYAGPAFLGYWNAGNNTPFLTNASCGAGDKFYYVVSDAGSTLLGPHNDWHPLDQAVCFNGTWDHVAPMGVDSIFGRMGDVVALYGDYSSALIEHAGAPLTATLNASYVTLGPNAGLPDAYTLAVVAGDLTLSGATLGMPGVPAFPAANNTVAGYPKNTIIDHQGRWVATDVGFPVETIVGVNGILITPINGTADAIGIDPNGTFSAYGAAVHQIAYNNAAGTFSTTTCAAIGLAQNTQLCWPPDNGASGNVLVGDGAGNLAYGVNGAALAFFDTTTAVSVTGASFQSLFGTGAGSRTIPANTLQPKTRIEYDLACTFINGAGSTTIRVVLGGTTLVTGTAFSGTSAVLTISGRVWVPSAGRLIATGEVYRSTTMVSVLTQPSPVTFVPASALTFDVQASMGLASISCYGAMAVYAK